MMRKIKTCLNQEWEKLSTEELDRILQAELEMEHPNEEVVLPILHELEEREKDLPVEKTPEILEMIEKLSKHETSSKQSKNRRGWITGIAAIAAVLCVVMMALPRTVGAESVFDVLFRWTSSVFEFFSSEQDEINPPVEYLFETDNPGLQQLYDKVTEQNVTDPVVPMWLPEGFELASLKEIHLQDGRYKVHAIFIKNERSISISYRISSDLPIKFEKEETAVEVFETGDISHFILVNEDNISVKWLVDGVECSVAANVQKENIYQIIKSIYRRSLQ